MADTLDDPVAQAHELVAAARQQFAKDVDLILADFSVEIALADLRVAILEKFGQYVPMARLADPVLLQLVREAYDLLENPESVIDHRDWKRSAAPFVKPRT